MTFNFSKTNMSLETINKYLESQGIELTSDEKKQINTIFQESDTWNAGERSEGKDGILNSIEASTFSLKINNALPKLKAKINSLIENLGLKFEAPKREIEAAPRDNTRVDISNYETVQETNVINEEKVTDKKELILKKPKKIDANTDIQSNYEWSEEKFANVLNIMLNNPKYGGKFKTSVLQGKAKAFIESGKKYNIDPRVLVAIAMHESARGTSKQAKKGNNVGGLVGGPFKSIEASIDTIAKTINRIYNKKGAKTINNIGPTGEYCDKKVGKQWSAQVSSYFNFFNIHYNKTT